MHYPATFYSGAPYPIDELIAGNAHLIESRKRMLAEGDLKRGSVLGIDRTSQTTRIAAADGNTGNADLSAVVVSAGRAAMPGVYVLLCTAASADAGTFEVRTPNGVDLGDLTVAQAFASEHISLTLPDGATDWDVGDVVHVTVADDGQMKLAAVGAVDGSAEPCAILSEDCDASLAPKACMCHFQGEFTAQALTFGTGHTAALVRESLRGKGIRLIDALPANER